MMNRPLANLGGCHTAICTHRGRPHSPAAWRAIAAITVIAGFVLTTIVVGGVAAEDWPGWRGPRGDGTSHETGVPTTWDGATGKNVVWKTAVPGQGHSSPIVSGERVFLTSAAFRETDADAPRPLEVDADRMLLCYDRRSGDELWRRTVITAAVEKKHKLNSFASGTPVTDGQLVYVTFLEPGSTVVTLDSDPDDPGELLQRQEGATPGEMIVAAYDFEGRQRWVVRPGGFTSVHGYCSSPILYEDLVIVNGDHDGDGYLVALDKTTGDVVWKIDRPNNTRSYCTPIIKEIDGRTQMVLSGTLCVTSYDPRDGSLHWMIDGPTQQFVASLVYDGKLLFLTAGFPERHILAIRPDGDGNVTKSHIVWRTTKGAAYVPSPIVEGDYFLVVSDTGIGSCFEAASGERLWMERLSRRHSSSLVSAEGLVYFLDDDGITKVIRPGPTLDVVAENALGEPAYASPAISEGQIFLRGEEHLFCIGKSSSE